MDPHPTAAWPHALTWALLLGLGGVVGSGALATGLGWMTQAALAWLAG
jgi:hypothetical protein